jgi:hypothetical protein
MPDMNFHGADSASAEIIGGSGRIHGQLKQQNQNERKFKSMNNRILVAILPVVACFALLPGARAVSPAPDGCYPNFTTAEGCNALAGLGAGAGNTGLGWYALFSAGDSNFSTGVGGGALALNTADSNTAVGAAALLLNTTGGQNVAVGTDALVLNDSGGDNNAFGYFALASNVDGDFNNAHGRGALQNNTGGQNNAFGDLAMLDNTSGSFNTAMGDDALDSCVDGSSNVAIGDEAGTDVVHGSHIICIGAGIVGGGPFTDLDNTCYIGSIYNEPVSDAGTAQAVYVDVNNVLGFLPSSQRFKHDIKPMDNASEVLLSLKPVTFKYNSDKNGKTQYGLIAEEVAKVAPDLVYRDKNGDVETVRFEQVGAMLLNEFLKEHKKVEDLQATVAQQQKGMEVLTAQLKEQAAQIQKVSAQLQMAKPATKVAVGNQ